MAAVMATKKITKQTMNRPIKKSHGGIFKDVDQPLPFLELHLGQKVDFLVDLYINGSVTNARTK